MNYRKLTKKELVELLELRDKPVSCNRPQKIYDYLLPYANKKQEHLIAVLLDCALNVIKTEVVSMGLLNRTICHPREVFAPAIENRASAIVLAHNHPSKNLEPSSNDMDVTDSIAKAGNILGIRLMDHIIFCENGYRSMLEQGDYKFN